MALQDIIRQVNGLSPDEQLHLTAYLVERARYLIPTNKPRRKWSEVAGIAPYPLTGEDAQTWITRSRAEEDERESRRREEK